MAIRTLTQSTKKTETDVGDIHKLVNGGLTSRLNHMVNRIQDHVDERFNTLEHRLRGLEGRLFVVEKEHADEMSAIAPTAVKNETKISNDNDD